MTIQQNVRSTTTEFHANLSALFTSYLNMLPLDRAKRLIENRKRMIHQIVTVAVLLALTFVLSQWIAVPLALVSAAVIIFSLAFATAEVTIRLEERRA